MPKTKPELSCLRSRDQGQTSRRPSDRIQQFKRGSATRPSKERRRWLPEAATIVVPRIMATTRAIKGRHRFSLARLRHPPASSLMR